MAERKALNTLIAAVDQCVNGARSGADARVVHYWWRKNGGEDAQFMHTVQAATADGYIEILPGDDMFLRMTVAGYRLRLESLEHGLADEVVDPADEQLDEDAAWEVAAPGQAMPADMLQRKLDEIFTTMGSTRVRPISAASLTRIWSIERMRGADLRNALDAMVASGGLLIHRGKLTSFQISEVGISRLSV